MSCQFPVANTTSNQEELQWSFSGEAHGDMQKDHAMRFIYLENAVM